VTKAATRMEASGLLARKPHPRDGRLVRLCLTERGWSLRRAIDDEIRRLSERALRTLDATERADAVRFLVEIRQNLVGADRRARAAERVAGQRSRSAMPAGS
jgi:MarR family transcriptional regulator, organic hydroperoxide resistance regulator